MDPTEAVTQAVGFGSAFTETTGSIVTQMSNIVSTIGANPLLLIGIGFGFVAGAIAIAKKLMHR